MAECRGEIHRLLLALVFFMVMNLKRLGGAYFTRLAQSANSVCTFLIPRARFQLRVRPRVDTAEMTKAMLEEDIGWLAHAKLLSQKEASFLKKTDVHN